MNPPHGCSFNPRCPFVMDVCRRVAPELRVTKSGHLVACHLY
ncbi:MAG: oligopeptide/dipeptide ABC transporter ATP-binding protein [Dehalococcoidia bacterium]